MYNELMKEEIKKVMKNMIEQLETNSLDKIKYDFIHYVELYQQICEFEELLQKTKVLYSSEISREEEQGKAEIFSQQVKPLQEEHPIKATSKGNKKGKVGQKNDDQWRPKIGAYVPKDIILKLGRSNDDYSYDQKAKKESKVQHVIGETELKFCLVEQVDNLLVINKTGESDETIRIDDIPFNILVKDLDVLKFELKKGDRVDIAFPTGHPEEAKVIRVHRVQKSINSKVKSATKIKKKVASISTKTIKEILPTLKAQTVLIVGNEGDKSKYKRSIEERGGKFLWCDAKDHINKLEILVKKSDMVVFLLSVSGHVGMEKIKEY